MKLFIVFRWNNMKENILIKLCVFSVILGIMIMFIANKRIEPRKVKISDVTECDEYIRVTGRIIKVASSKSGTLFFKLEDETGKIDIVVFKDSVRDAHKIRVGDFVEIMGRPERYKGKLEIIATKILEIKR